MAKLIYDDAKDKNVATVVIYADDSDDLYYDATTQTEDTAVPDTALFDLFIKGVVCVKDDVYYKALSYDESTGINFGFPVEGSV